MVFWRDWKDWLKGGIIYTAIVVVLFFVGNQLYAVNFTLGRIFTFLFTWLGKLSWSAISKSSISHVILYLISFIQAFIIGSLIGLVVKKVSKKDRNPRGNNISKKI